MKIKRSAGEQIGYAIIVTLLVLFAFSTLYPFWHVLMYSISDSGEAMSGGLFFLPRKPTLLAYRTVLRTRQIFVAYRNTILKTYKISTGAHRCAPCRSPCLLPSPSSPPSHPITLTPDTGA